MQTVNFQCGHCGNLMAVGTDFLGQQVRCPHCQQIVVAPGEETPAAASSAPEESKTAVVDPAAGGEQESIFTPAEPPSDDLFGGAAPPSQLEIPPQPQWRNLQVDSPTVQEPFQPHDASALGSAPALLGPPGDGNRVDPGGATATFMPPQPDFPAMSRSAATDDKTLVSPPGDWPASGGSGESNSYSDAPVSLAPRPAARRGGGGLVSILILIFLIPYAIFATAAAVYFYYQQQRAPHPLEFLPDWPGDHPGATRKTGSIMFRKVSADTPLPPHLHVPLRHAIQVGDLSVVPEKVEQTRVVFCFENAGRKPVQSQEDALVLTLRLRNTSSDDYFAPTDAAFSTRWKEGEPAVAKPYTFLEVGAQHFYGGPFQWRPRGQRSALRDEDPREYIQGQEHTEEILRPGEERTTVICTDPSDPAILRSVQHHQGPLLWRVQLRRGLERIGERLISASAVIGVEFNKKDIEGAGSL
jgi:hypothetical protein